jgi:hypothetical protein
MAGPVSLITSQESIECNLLATIYRRWQARLNPLHLSAMRSIYIPLSLYPDYTVGPGITPGLLTLSPSPCKHGIENKRSRAKHIACHYRRWGITPRPENVCDYTLHDQQRTAASRIYHKFILAPTSATSSRQGAWAMLISRAVFPACVPTCACACRGGALLRIC